MSDKRKWMVGRWEHLSDLSNVVFEVCEGSRGLIVRSFDKEDGEEAIVSKTKWDGEELRFELYWRSTRYRTIDVITPLSATKILLEYTFWEPWTKVPRSQVRVSDRKQDRPGGKKGWLIGRWTPLDGFSNLEIDVRPTAKGVRVFARCTSDGEEAEISKTRWDGKVLRFESYLRSARYRVPHALRPVSSRRVIHQMTWSELRMKADSKKRTCAPRGRSKG